MLVIFYDILTTGIYNRVHLYRIVNRDCIMVMMFQRIEKIYLNNILKTKTNGVKTLKYNIEFNIMIIYFLTTQCCKVLIRM